jgi:DnaA regulatory inactivator Hda
LPAIPPAGIGPEWRRFADALRAVLRARFPRDRPPAPVSETLAWVSAARTELDEQSDLAERHRATADIRAGARIEARSLLEARIEALDAMLEDAAGRLRDALQAFEHADLVALDGLDAVAGDREDEIALFDAHNRARDAGRTLLYAARIAPDALELVLPDLRSRLSQCARIALEALDDAGRAEVLRLRAQRRGLQLEDAAIDWLLKRVDRDLVSLTGLLDRLDRESLAAQRRLTVPFLRGIVGQE